MQSAFRSRRAFTLIELLVVIGIIAVLLAILLPALGRVRVASQSAACLSNLRQIGIAARTYQSETGRIPLYVMARAYPGGGPYVPNGGSVVGALGYLHGGMSTHPGVEFFYLDESDKPLNRYIYRDVELPGNWDGTRTPADQRPRRDVFRCPGDRGYNPVLFDDDGNPLPRDTRSVPSLFSAGGVPDMGDLGVDSAYEAVGTSYFTNSSFKYAKVFGGGDVLFALGNDAQTPARIRALNHKISRAVAKQPASRFVLIGEFSFDSSLRDGQLQNGLHGKFSRHNVLFLDGHAREVEIRAPDLDPPPGYSGTLYPHRGEGWTEFDEP